MNGGAVRTQVRVSIHFGCIMKSVLVPLFRTPTTTTMQVMHFLFIHYRVKVPNIKGIKR